MQQKSFGVAHIGPAFECSNEYQYGLYNWLYYSDLKTNSYDTKAWIENATTYS